MRRTSLIFAAGLIAAAAAPPAAAGEATATLENRDGAVVGTVTLRDTPHGALIHAELDGLPAGTHAFHIHAKGACTPGFDAAGGHYNPDGREHGLANPGGMHAGDMPNIHLPASGKLEIEILNPRVAVDERLLDQDGAAVVIHAGADDYTTDPAGDAGERIACGVIEG